MRTITLENGTKVEISEDLHDYISQKNNAVVDTCPKITCYEDAFELVEPRWEIEFDLDVLKTQFHCPKRYPTKAIAKREAARIKLITLAHALNDGWEPDWDDSIQKKWHVSYHHYDFKLNCHYGNKYNKGLIYFKDYKTAEYAIEIAGDLFLQMFGVK